MDGGNFFRNRGWNTKQNRRPLASAESIRLHRAQRARDYRVYYWLVAAALIFIAFLIAGNYFVVSQLQREASRDTTDYSAIKAPPSSSE